MKKAVLFIGNKRQDFNVSSVETSFCSNEAGVIQYVISINPLREALSTVVKEEAIGVNKPSAQGVVKHRLRDLKLTEVMKQGVLDVYRVIQQVGLADVIKHKVQALSLISVVISTSLYKTKDNPIKYLYDVVLDAAKELVELEHKKAGDKLLYFETEPTLKFDDNDSFYIIESVVFIEPLAEKEKK